MSHYGEAAGKSKRRITLSQLQEEQAAWAQRNFPDSMVKGDFMWQLLGIVEEVGELAHAGLKHHQDIRGSKDKHLNDMKDAVADAIIFMAGLCTTMGFDMEEVVSDTWEMVRKRDWLADKVNGQGGTE